MDQDDLDESYLVGVSSSKGSTNRLPTEESPRPRSPSSPAALRAPGRNSRRVSLIPGEALEQANSAVALMALVQAQVGGGSQQERHNHSKTTDHDPTCSPPALVSPDTEALRAKPRVVKAKTTDDATGGGTGEGGVGDVGGAEGSATTTNSSPIR